MLACVRTAAVFGIEAVAVSVEVDVSFGLPDVHDGRACRTRASARAAIACAALSATPASSSRRTAITVNLAPADVRKAGAAFDLPIALGVLAAAGVVERRRVDDIVLIGELSLDGAIQADARRAADRRGGAPAQGCTRPPAAGRQRGAKRRWSAGLAIWPVSLAGRRGARAERSAIADRLPRPIARAGRRRSPQPDLADVRGQPLARRALGDRGGRRRTTCCSSVRPAPARR